MTKIQCVKCKGRLFDLGEGGKVEDIVIRCGKCGYDNKITIIEPVTKVMPVLGKGTFMNPVLRVQEIGKRIVIE